MNQRGVTLVELFIVIAIMTILAAIAIPQLQAYWINENLKAAAQSLQGDIFDCKQRTLAETREYGLVFLDGTSQYQIHQCAAPPFPATCATAAAPVLSTQNLATFDPLITITADTFAGANMSCFLRGTVDVGTITLTNGRGSTATITTNIMGKSYVTYSLQ